MDSLDKMNNQLMTETLQCDAAAGLEAGLKIAALSGGVQTVNGMPLIVLPEGFSAKTLPDLLQKPLRKTGNMRLLDLESFARFFKTHRTSNSIIVADVDPKGARGAKFTAVFNYHGAETTASDFADFRAEYTAALSVEWSRWMAQNGKPMEHAPFLEHLEASQEIIIEPTGAALLELISSLEGKVHARFANALSLHNGKMKLSFEEDVELRANSVSKAGEMEVPAELTTALSPFEFGDPYKVRNRLRYRVANRQLVFGYEVVDPHKIIQDAAAGQMKKLTELTDCQPLYGQV